MVQKKKNPRAFSTPEVLLSVFVLSIGLITIVQVMGSSLRYTLGNRESIVATGLAQEGVELVRNVRDNNFASNPSNTGFSAFDNAKSHCKIDWNDSNNSLDCDNNKGSLAGYTLVYSNGFYAHSASATGGRFYRYLFIQKQPNGSGGNNERATVRSFVFWGAGAAGTLSSFGNNGDSDSCDVASSCVFTEAFLTSWN